jgi:hypothetical protein
MLTCLDAALFLSIHDQSPVQMLQAYLYAELDETMENANGAPH